MALGPTRMHSHAPVLSPSVVLVVNAAVFLATEAILDESYDSRKRAVAPARVIKQSCVCSVRARRQPRPRRIAFIRMLPRSESIGRALRGAHVTAEHTQCGPSDSDSGNGNSRGQSFNFASLQPKQMTGGAPMFVVQRLARCRMYVSSRRWADNGA